MCYSSFSKGNSTPRISCYWLLPYPSILRYVVGTVCQIKPSDSFKLIRKLTLRWNPFWSSIYIKSSRKGENRFWKWETKEFPMWLICWILLVSWLIDGFLNRLIGCFLLVNWLISKLVDRVIFILDLLKLIFLQFCFQKLSTLILPYKSIMPKCDD